MNFSLEVFGTCLLPQKSLQHLLPWMPSSLTIMSKPWERAATAGWSDTQQNQPNGNHMWWFKIRKYYPLIVFFFPATSLSLLWIFQANHVWFPEGNPSVSPFNPVQKNPNVCWWLIPLYLHSILSPIKSQWLAAHPQLITLLSSSIGCGTSTWVSSAIWGACQAVAPKPNESVILVLPAPPTTEKNEIDLTMNLGRLPNFMGAWGVSGQSRS